MGILLQTAAYSYIAFVKPANYISHPFFYDVALIGFISLAIQIGGFAVIMSKTLDADPVIYIGTVFITAYVKLLIFSEGIRVRFLDKPEFSFIKDVTQYLLVFLCFCNASEQEDEENNRR